MKNHNLLLSLIAVFFVAITLNANAQFGDLLQKAKDKAAKKASDAMDSKTTDAPASTNQKSTKLTINSIYDFVPGDSTIFSENFSAAADGSTTHILKTNGSATVVSVKEVGGKWVALDNSATYKLSKQLFYHKRFTVEFDLLAIADQTKDIYPVQIGFVKDNSVTNYNSGEGAYLDLKYYNGDDVSVNSSFISKYFNTRFDLASYGNRPMHVAIAVEGERMIVYLDKTKVGDAQAFLPGTAKNLYISGPMQYQNGAKVLVSNFKIAEFKR